jgi:hypothetical protein
MEIPDFLAKMTVGDYPKMVFMETLLTDGPCGVIIKGTAFFDDHLLQEVLLAFRPGRGQPFTPFRRCPVSPRGVRQTG